MPIALPSASFAPGLLANASIRVQILILAVLLVVLVSLTAMITEPLLYGRQAKDIGTGLFLGEAGTIAKLYAASATPAERETVLALASGQGLAVRRVDRAAAPPDAILVRDDGDLVAAAHRIDAFHPLHWLTGRAEASSAVATVLFPVLPDAALSFRLPPPPPGTWVLAPVFSGILKIVVPLAVMAYASITLLVKPLERIAEAARRQSIRDETSPEPFAVEGAAEIRSLALSLNTMRTRIQRMAIDRTQILRSVSHDLRTPLTRLRLRAERCDQPGLRQSMLRDIDQLAFMINETLRFLNNRQEDAVKVDLSSLLQTIVSDFADAGIGVVFDPPPKHVVVCKPQGLTRALSNLIDNAARYAATITLRLEACPGGAARISVIDDGPGIPDALKQRVLEPMVKADAARPSDTGSAGGFGLGLTIAKGIVEVGHNGRFVLKDSVPGGLTVEIELPGLAGPARTDA